ncbi:hypothetical protein B0H10DRAFT_2060136 [Mycena sp. CBHHK59/15]|nr:hypothetical protein B0H10DRAFT_2060136 [Mycena sp. CBHHK59/15]
MVNLGFTNTLWSSRMSVMFSVIRIIPQQFKLRKVTNYFAVLFGVMWAALMAYKLYICASDRSWYAKVKPQCHLGKGVATAELLTDFVADLVLAGVPIELLRGVNMIQGSKRRMLIIIFAASLLTTLASIVHAVYVLGPTGLLEGISAQAEAATALLVANAGALVTAVYRYIRKQRDGEPSTYTYDYSIHSAGIVRMQKIAVAPTTSTVVFKHLSTNGPKVDDSGSSSEVDHSFERRKGRELGNEQEGHASVVIQTQPEST